MHISRSTLYKWIIEYLNLFKSIEISINIENLIHVDILKSDNIRNIKFYKKRTMKPKKKKNRKSNKFGKLKKKHFKMTPKNHDFILKYVNDDPCFNMRYLVKTIRDKCKVRFSKSAINKFLSLHSLINLTIVCKNLKILKIYMHHGT